MAAVTYLDEAATDQYDSVAFDYIQSLINAPAIRDTAAILGISAGAIAGAMAEENHSYIDDQWLNDRLDDYGLSGIDPVTFAALAVVVGPDAALAAAIFSGERTHEEWAADYDAIGGDAGSSADSLDKLLHPVNIDLGSANFKMSTAIRMIQDYAISEPALGLE